MLIPIEQSGNKKDPKNFSSGERLDMAEQVLRLIGDKQRELAKLPEGSEGKSGLMQEIAALQKQREELLR